MSIDQPVISVIVPVFNMKKYLDRCMESLLSQTIVDQLEILLIDDGSTDSSPEMCDTYAYKYKNISVIHRENGGLGLARNTGLEAANGDFVAFVDSDDYVDRNMYERLLSFARANQLDCVIAGGFYKVDRHGGIQEYTEIDQPQFFKDDQTRNVVKGMIASGPSDPTYFLYEMSVWRALYSRSIIEQNRISFYSERQYISEDILFHMEYMEHSQHTGLMPEIFYYYCENPTSLTRVLRTDRFDKTIVLYQKVIDMLKGYNYDAESFEYADKFLLLREKDILAEIIERKKELSVDYEDMIHTMLNDSVFQSVLSHYPIDQMPIKRRVFFKLCKKKQKKVLELLIVFLHLFHMKM